MPTNKGQFKPGDARTKELARKAGKIGGKKSPSNFKNNKELARTAGRASGVARKKLKYKKDLGPFGVDKTKGASALAKEPLYMEEM